MESKKICRLLILIFTVLSLLFYQLYRIELKKRTILPEDLVEGAVENLNSSGVEISQSIVERRLPERDIFFYQLENQTEYYDAITSGICKTLFGDNTVTLEFSTPEGSTFGIYDGQSDDKQLGRILFSESDLSFEFSRNGISMTDGDSPIENMQTEEVDGKVLSDIEALIMSISEGTRLSYRVTGSASNDEFLIVTVMQTIGGDDISNVFLNFVFADGELSVISGKWITEIPKAKYHNTLLDGVNVLYKLDIKNVGSIEKESIVYSLRMSEDNKYFVLPGWRIEYTDKAGNLVTEYFDAL